MTKIKICGITNIEDALCAAETGADYIGFVFWKGSPRYIKPEDAALIIKKLPSSVTTVGVFVDQTPEEVSAIIKTTGIDCIQLHGDETPWDYRVSGKRIIKAYRVNGEDILSTIKKQTSGHRMLEALSMKSYSFDLLLDTYKSGVQGGTGETFDWDIAVKAKEYGNVILSGGLTPENVAAAIERVRPYGVDVSSGVEISPGKKDRSKTLKFIEEVRKMA